MSDNYMIKHFEAAAAALSACDLPIAGFTGTFLSSYRPTVNGCMIKFFGHYQGGKLKHIEAQAYDIKTEDLVFVTTNRH